MVQMRVDVKVLMEHQKFWHPKRDWKIIGLGMIASLEKPVR